MSRVKTGGPSGATGRRPLFAKLVGAACAFAITAAIAAVPMVGQLLPVALEGGQAYAASYVTTSSSATSTAAVSVSEGTYSFQCRWGGRMVDVPGCTNANNAAIKTWTGNGCLAQRYIVKKVAANTYAIQAGCSGKYLADRSGTVVQQTKASTSAQRWQFVKNGSYMMIRNVATGRFVTVGGSGNSASLRTTSRTGATSQMFTMRSAQLIKSGYYILGSGTGNRVLDLAAASTSYNANVQIWIGNNTNAQKWYIQHAGNGYYRLTNAASGQLLSVYGPSKSNSANVVQYRNVNTAAQLWMPSISDNGGIVLVNKYSGRALAVSGNRNYDGANVVQTTACNASGQRWFLYGTSKIAASRRSVYVGGVMVSETVDYNGVKTVSIPNGTYIVRSAMGTRSLDVAAGSKQAGANVQIWMDNGTNAQKWNIVSAGNGYYTLKGANTGYALDVVNGRAANGTNVRQWYANNSAAQRWRAELYGSSLVFVNEATGRALDVSGGCNRDGQNVQIWDRNNSAAQRWTLTSTRVVQEDGFVDASFCYTQTNTYRSWYGRAGIVRDAALESYAKVRAQELVRLFSHTRPDGTSGARGALNIVGGYGTAAENIARGQSTTSMVMSGWYSSTGHRNNMLNPSIRRAGMAGYRCNGVVYWVQVFTS